MRSRYTPGYGGDYVQALQRRSAATHAHFLTPLLRPGMSLIDFGCGPGMITLDLAELVAPGPVLGIDIEPSQIDLANPSTTAMAEVRSLPARSTRGCRSAAQPGS